MNLPNKLTLFRMILVIPFIVLFSIVIHITNDSNEIKYTNQYGWYLFGAGVIFIFAMITDFFDGYFARKNNEITTFGKLFDPIADKMMITTSIIFLVILNYTYIIILIVIIIRDLIVDGSRVLAAKNHVSISASFWGKLKTFCQSFSIPLLIFIYPVINQFGNDIWWHKMLINIPMIITTFLSIGSGVKYLVDIKGYITVK